MIIRTDGKIVNRPSQNYFHTWTIYYLTVNTQIFISNRYSSKIFTALVSHDIKLVAEGDKVVEINEIFLEILEESARRSLKDIACYENAIGSML